MCRMFGLVASRATALGPWLSDADASLRTLSVEHADGWGLASHDATSGWSVEKHATCAARCTRFSAVAQELRATLAIAHVRKATVGANCLKNTHPFVRARHVFAHNGTIPRADVLAQRTSSARAAEIEGQTDSERFFAFLLTRLDERGDAEMAVMDAIAEIRSIPEFGSASFLFSDGATLFAYRQGRSLFFGTCARAGVTLIASEPLGDSTFHEVEEGELLTIDVATGTTRRLPHDARASRAGRSADFALRAG